MNLNVPPQMIANDDKKNKLRLFIDYMSILSIGDLIDQEPNFNSYRDGIDFYQLFRYKWVLWIQIVLTKSIPAAQNESKKFNLIKEEMEFILKKLIKRDWKRSKKLIYIDFFDINWLFWYKLTFLIFNQLISIF